MNRTNINLSSIHICIITTVHNCRDVRIFKKEAMSLVNAGYRVTLIAPGVHQIIENNVVIIPIRQIRNKIFRGFGNFLTMYKAFKQRANIYHFHDPDFFIFAVFLRIFSGEKIIFDVHEDFGKVLLERDWIPRALRGTVVFGYNVLKKFCIQYFSGIISATEHIDSTIHHSNKTIVHNYPFVSTNRKNSNKLPFSIIYIGGITRIRGIYNMLSAIRKAREKIPVTLDLYGGFESSVFENEIINQFNGEYIRFHGFIRYEVLLEQARKYQIGIITYLPFPNHMEAMPTKLFEYLMLGLPVIGSNFPLWKTIIEGNSCGMTCDPQNIDEIAERIILMFRDEKQLKKFKKNSRQCAVKQYSWESEEKKLIEFYMNLETV